MKNVYLNMMYYRNCPKCNNEITYKSKDSRNTQERKNGLCRSCATKKDWESKPGKNKGDKNGRFGKKLSDLMSDDNYNKWLLNKNKFKSGKDNPFFGKEPPKGSGIGYSGWYKDIFFRSSYELIFIIKYEKDNNILLKSAESMGIKIKYGDNKNYIPDFYCDKTDTLYEVKSEYNAYTELTLMKSESAKKIFKNYKLITEKYLFDGEIQSWNDCIKLIHKLHQSNEIKLTSKSIEKLNKNRNQKL